MKQECLISDMTKAVLLISRLCVNGRKEIALDIPYNEGNVFV